MHVRKLRKSISLAAVVAAFTVTSAWAQQILPVTALGWPNGRTSNQQPYLAADGNVGTYTWTTESFSTAKPAYIGLDFGSSYYLNRIRLWKDNDNGCGGQAPPDLVIQYTTGAGPLSGRTWTTVTTLQTGYQGETLQAAAVNLNGTVSADGHDSVNEGHGWASLTFDVVQATGVRISFSGTAACSFNHYKVHEFEAYYESTIASEPTTWGKIKNLYR